MCAHFSNFTNRDKFIFMLTSGKPLALIMDAASTMASYADHIVASGWCVSCVGSCLGVLFGSPVRASAFSIQTHSQQETWHWRSKPHGFAYFKSPRGQQVCSPADEYSSLLRQSSPGSASVPTPARLSRAPRPGCDSPPRPLPGVSPSRRKACLFRWLVY